jgi:hypothetical protein
MIFLVLKRVCLKWWDTHAAVLLEGRSSKTCVNKKPYVHLNSMRFKLYNRVLKALEHDAGGNSISWV